MKTRYKYLPLVVLLFSAITMTAGSQTHSVIFKAMEDEMARSMNELTYEDYSQPYFVAYTVSENVKCDVLASLGAVVESGEDQSVNCFARIMVGSYDLNDEKFNDKVNRVRYNDGGFPSLEKADYYGIRRSLWLMTNNIYKSASEKFKNKCDLMEKEGLTVEDLKAPDFSKEAKIEHLEEPLANEKDKAFLEAWAQELSSVFMPYTDLLESDVAIKYANQTSYMLNSEGSKSQIPTRLYSVVIKAKLLSEKNKPMSQVLRYYASSFDELPNKDEIKSDIEALVNNLYALRQAPEYRGKYEGPLLLQDQAVLYRNLISVVRRGNGLMANARGLVNDKSKGLGLATFFTWEDMKGKRVLDKKLSILALPTMDSYKDEPLLGSVHCDVESVLVPDSIVLIDNGVLKNQLNNRTPTPSQRHSNGHQLPYFKNGSFGWQLGASVVKVEANEVSAMDSLYAKLKALAKDEDLDHAIVMRPLASHADEAPVNTYQLDLATGEESLLAGTSYMGRVSDLKKIEAFGSGQVITNALVANQSAIDSQRKKIARYPDWIKEIIMMQLGDEGSPSSFIYPDAFLMKRATVNGSQNTLKSKPRVVPSPLAVR